MQCQEDPSLSLVLTSGVLGNNEAGMLEEDRAFLFPSPC